LVVAAQECSFPVDRLPVTAEGIWNTHCAAGAAAESPSPPLVFEGGCVRVPKKPGLGLDLDERKMLGFAL
jgi:L-alanine-DL-glutamate epimerase-like enolase superfamily enzyme